MKAAVMTELRDSIATVRAHQRQAVATWEEAVDLEQHALDEAEAARRIQAAAKHTVDEDSKRIDRLLELIPREREASE